MDRNGCGSGGEMIKKKTGYRYFKTSRKGEPVFRRNTDQTLCEVETYLKESNINYEYRLEATALKIYNKEEIPFIYYFTTGRWKRYNGRKFPHYHSNSVQDFAIKYLNRKFDDNRS